MISKTNTISLFLLLLTITSYAQEIKTLQTRFVSSKNGVNFRDKPNGTKLGVFPYNKQLAVIEYSDSIYNVALNGKKVNSFWVGVKHNGQKVYVVDAYLHYDKNVTNLISENKYYIFIDKVLKDRKATKYKNDSTFIDEFPLKDFISIKPMSKNEFEKIYKKNQRLTQILHPKEKDTVLTIKCTNGKKLVLKDLTFSMVEYDEQIENFKYMGTFKKINSHFIRMNLYETTSHFLVNSKDCAVTNISGEPIFNENFTKLIGIDTDSYEYSDIFIYDFSKNKLELKYFFELGFLINRSIFINNTLYVESNTSWHDGKIQKFSEQFFKIEFKNKI